MAADAAAEAPATPAARNRAISRSVPCTMVSVSRPYSPASLTSGAALGRTKGANQSSSGFFPRQSTFSYTCP